MNGTWLQGVRWSGPLPDGAVHDDQGVRVAATLTRIDGNIDIRTRADVPNEYIDADGLTACRGLVDIYARLREPGASRKGTLASESHAALRSGITTLLCAPDTHPVIDSTATVELIRERLRQREPGGGRGVRVLPIAALTQGLAGETLTEMATLTADGCVAVGQADLPLHDTSVLRSAMEYAATFDIPLVMRAMDARLTGRGCAHDGALASRLGLPAIPRSAETVAIATLIELCRETRCRLHLSRISTARAAEMVDAAKQAGLPVSADVGIHHLYFTDAELAGFDVNFHSAVPFRDVSDRDALRQALASGVIDAVCSDHAPHDNDAKLAPFPASAPGLSALDSFLPLLLGLEPLTGLDQATLLNRASGAPARILGIEDDGADDVVLIDTSADWDPSPALWRSRGQNSPLLDSGTRQRMAASGVVLKGKVQGVFSSRSG